MFIDAFSVVYNYVLGTVRAMVYSVSVALVTGKHWLSSTGVIKLALYAGLFAGIALAPIKHW